MKSKRDIIQALRYQGNAQEQLLKAALFQKERTFGHDVLVRGVIEVTNLCRVNCDYCPMRRDNTRQNTTYVMEPDEIVRVSKRIKEFGINVVFLQGGEIPQTTRTVGEAIPKIRDYFNDKVEILLCLGNKSRDEYEYLFRQGATSYIIKHETSDKELHEKSRHASYSERLECIHHLLEIGYKVGIGTIIGLPGQSVESIADDILLARRLGVHMASASPLIPAPNTPYERLPPGSIDLTLNAIALMRLAVPSLFIPSVSALEKISPGGQLRGLKAGANVVTINFTPAHAREQYLIYGKNRYVVKKTYTEDLLKLANARMTGSYWL